MGLVRHRAQDDQEADVETAAGGQDGVAQTNPCAKTGAWLNQMLKGYLNYYAVSGNSPSLWWYFNEVRWHWLKSLKRRSQRAFMSWEKFTSITARFFPSIRILHPLSCHRFDARTRGTSPVR
jgi:RNA-directed DNA polymerase